MDGFILLVAIVIVGAVILYAKHYIQSLKTIYNQSYNQARCQGLAQRVAEGDKLIGEPWEQMFGPAYLMTPEQIVETGIGLKGPDFLKRCTGDGPCHFRTLGLTSLDDRAVVDVLDRDCHILTIVPTRSGKGVSAAELNLMIYRCSMVVNDVKGELHVITANWRRQIEQRVLRFAPFETIPIFGTRSI